MKKNKQNMEILTKRRTKIAPPELEYFLEKVVPDYYEKMKTISTIDFADRVFSEYVRLTHANKEGYVQCVTCGKRFHRTEIQNGHYKKRNRYKYRYDIINCHPQCYACNVRLEWNYRNYCIYMQNTYGVETESKIWNDQDLVKLYDYDLINRCAVRHRTIVEIKAQLIDN